jgi:hypothetical protein
VRRWELSSEVCAWWSMERNNNDGLEEAVGGIVATLAEGVKNFVDQRRVWVRDLIWSRLTYKILLS